jgi:hypothetical protein
VEVLEAGLDGEKGLFLGVRFGALPVIIGYDSKYDSDIL